LRYATPRFIGKSAFKLVVKKTGVFQMFLRFFPLFSRFFEANSAFLAFSKQSNITLLIDFQLVKI